MRLPYSHTIRTSIRNMVEPLLVRAGILRAEPYFVISSKNEPISSHVPKYSREDFDQVLTATGVMADPKTKEWAYHCFVTRWSSVGFARLAFIFRFKPKSFVYSSLKYHIDASIDLSGKDHSEDWILIDHEDVLEWILSTCRSTVYFCIICRRPDIGAESVSLGIQFSDRKEAVAYKMVFG